MPQKPEELWITNISQTQDISIGDLRLTIRQGQSINLLAKKKNGTSHYSFSRKQIDASIESGSIFKKSNLIKVRKVPPIIFSTRMDSVDTFNIAATRQKRKATEIEVMEYPDLVIEEGSLEDYARDNADMDFADRQPILPVDPKFKKPTVDE